MMATGNPFFSHGDVMLPVRASYRGVPVLRLDVKGKRAAERHTKEWQSRGSLETARKEDEISRWEREESRKK